MLRGSLGLKPDAQLVQGCLRGDGPAWEELVQRHARRVFNLCYRFTSNRTDAEDLSQEVFLRIYRTLPSYRRIRGFPTWLTSVTRNLLVDHYRRTRHDRATDSIEDTPHLEEKPSAARTPDRWRRRRIERAASAGAGEAFAGLARGGDSARPARA